MLLHDGGAWRKIEGGSGGAECFAYIGICMVMLHRKFVGMVWCRMFCLYWYLYGDVA